MFEVITLSQPQDYQSLEILKEAYFKLGRAQDVVNTSRKIAEAYVQLGQLSSAILEYESILQRYPDDPEVKKALLEIERRATSLSEVPAIESDFVEKASASAALKKAAEPSPGTSHLATDVDDGKSQMQKLFVDGKLVTMQDFEANWPKPSLNGRASEPFIHTLAERQILPLERSLKVLCEKARIAYLPIEKYDVDIEFARTFPRESCLRWCVLPFDRMSKSILVATANPFNKQAAKELEAHTRARIVWYIAPPGELVKVLKKIFR